MPPAGSATPPPSLPRRFALADLVVDTGRVTVTRGAERVSLPGLSFDLLVELARSAPNVVTHDELMERVWRGVIVSPETVSQRVKLLRDALGDDPREPRYVAGVRGRGYRLLVDVVPVPDATPVPDAVPTPDAVPVPDVPSLPDAVPLPETVPAPADADSRPASREGPHASDVAAEAGTARHSSAAPASSVTPAPAAASTPAPKSGIPQRAVVVALVLVFAIAAVAFFTLRREADAPSAPPPTAQSVEVVGVQARAVAVLPFANLSADPANAFIGLGIAEMVLNRLATSDTLFVLARSSSFAFENRNVDAREIGRQLGARYLVQGSVQRAGDRLRVTAQLVDAQTGRQLEVVQADRNLGELFALQDEIAAQMAAALDVAVPPAKDGTRNVDAQLEYLQGLAALGRWSVTGAQSAIGHFQRAQALDPKFAAAYAGEAEAVRLSAVLREDDIDTVKPRLRELVDRALGLDPNLGQAYVVRALLHDSPEDKERDLRRGIALAPNYGEGYYRLATLLASKPARRAEGLTLYDRAIAVDPMRPRYRFVRAMEAEADGTPHESVRAEMHALLARDPDFTPALHWLATAYAFTDGDYSSALSYAERAHVGDRATIGGPPSLVDLYFAIDDVPAALDAARGTERELVTTIAAAVARGDRRGAARLAFANAPPRDGRPAAPPHALGSVVELAIVAAILDESLRTGDHARGIRLLRDHHCRPAKGDDWCLRPMSIMALISIAQLQIAAGDRRAGEAQLDRAKRFLDAEPDDYGLPYAGRARIAMLRGQPQEAVRELASAIDRNLMLGWWVTVPHDPTFDAIRDTPPFQAVLAQARRHAAKERAEVEALRNEGRLPRRPAP